MNNTVLAAKPGAATATLRRIAGTGILQINPGHTPALFINPQILELWPGK